MKWVISKAIEGSVFLKKRKKKIIIVPDGYIFPEAMLASTAALQMHLTSTNLLIMQLIRQITLCINHKRLYEPLFLPSTVQNIKRH